MLLILILVSCKESPDNPSDTTNSVSGTLVDEQGNAIPEAVIEINNNTSILTVISKDTTDENGQFHVTQLPDDLTGLNISVIHPDFKHFTDKLSNFKTKTTSPVMLSHYDSCGGEINIFTFKSADSTTLSGVEIRLFRNGQLIRKASTVEGKLTFGYICPGTYIVRLFKPYYGLIYDSVHIESTDTILRSYYMRFTQNDSCCHGKLCVTPLDSATGLPLAGTTVDLYLNNTLLNSYKYENTPVCFTSICPGNYYVHLSLDGYNGYGFGVTMKCNDTISIRRSLLKTPPQDTCCKGVYRISLIDKMTGKATTRPSTLKLLLNGTAVQTATATNGLVYFTKLCPGDYQIDLTSDYYLPLNWSYTSVCNKVDTVTKYLDPKPNADSCCHGKIEVSIVDSANGNPIDSVRVQLSKNGTSLGGYNTVNGKVLFTGLCPGEYSLYYSSKTGWNRPNLYTWNVTMGCNDTAGFTRTLYRTPQDTCCHGVIVVNVKHTNNGTPIDSVNVILQQNGQNLKTILTVNGVATFTGVCPGTYSFYYYKTNMWRSDSPSWNVTMGCNDNKDFTKNMIPLSDCCNGIINGTVSDSTDNTAIGNVKVSLYAGSTLKATVYTDANGAFRITEVCPGTYTLNFFLDGYFSRYVTNLIMGCNDTGNNFSIKMLKR